MTLMLETRSDELLNVNHAFMSKWKTSFDYNAAVPIERKGNEDFRLSSHPLLYKNLRYIKYLYEFMLGKDRIELPTSIQQDLMSWTKKGGISIYLSSLLYAMFDYQMIANQSSMSYWQGACIVNDTPQLHAWIEIDNAIVDVFPIDHTLVPIVGINTTSMKFMGYEEHPSTVHYNCIISAIKNDQTFHEWLELHLNTSEYINS